jgi:hypothetical protein
LVEEAELRRRQLAALAADVRLHLTRVDSQLLDLDRIAARRSSRPRSLFPSAPDAPRRDRGFYRGDRARTTYGTGLGLAIVKHEVTQAGGSVEARRGPGGLGLEVRCTFPG